TPRRTLPAVVLSFYVVPLSFGRWTPPTPLAVGQQAGHTHAAGPESGPGAVDCTIRLAPPVFGLVERGLHRCGRGLAQPLDPHTDEAHPGPLQAEGVIEAARDGGDLAGDVGGVPKGLRTGDRREVGESDLDAHRPADEAGGPQPGRGGAGEAEDRAVDDVRVVDVVLVGALVADAALLADRLHAARVTPPGQVVQVGSGRLAEGAHQRLPGGVGDVGDRAQPQAGELLLRPV